MIATAQEPNPHFASVAPSHGESATDNPGENQVLARDPGGAISARLLRVALVEDDDSQRTQLLELIIGIPSVTAVGSWGTLGDALENLPDLTPDVVLVDIGLRGESGVDLVRQLKGRMPQTQFMMLTVVKDTTRVFAALEAGATGYLLKKDAPERLAHALADLAAGGSPMSSAIARQVVLAFQIPAQTETTVSPNLSPREREVLDLLAQGLLYKEIADTLQLGVGTVRTHIRRIYEKLHVRNRAEALAHTTRRPMPWKGQAL